VTPYENLITLINDSGVKIFVGILNSKSRNEICMEHGMEKRQFNRAMRDMLAQLNCADRLGVRAWARERGYPAISSVQALMDLKGYVEPRV
jgi:hypothetical protein